MALIGSLNIPSAGATDEFPVLALGEVVEADEDTDVVAGERENMAGAKWNPDVTHWDQALLCTRGRGRV